LLSAGLPVGQTMRVSSLINYYVWHPIYFLAPYYPTKPAPGLSARKNFYHWQHAPVSRHDHIYIHSRPA
ncbi:hypothetical protein PH346_22845, partial [Escherichia coli]|uniref:hypothetical protein n=1 Tax=Escherichia coli TaxID=562 RepID=UPI0022F38317